MNRTVKSNLCKMIKKVAIYKANANCIGFMYEAKKPTCLMKNIVENKAKK